MDNDRRKMRELFAKMPFSEKMQHLFREFRYHILVILVLILIAAVSLVNLIQQQKTVLWGVVINYSAANTEELADHWAASIGLDGQKAVSLIDDVSIDLEEVSNTGSLSYGSALQIICSAAVGELDFVFTDDQGLQFLWTEDLCRDPNSVLPEDLRLKWSARFYTPETLQSPIALDISDTPVAENMGLTGENVFLVIPALSGNTQELESFLRCLLDAQ